LDNISVGSNNNIEQEWQARLIAVGVSVRASAWLNLPQFGVVNFDGKLPENYPNWTKLDEAWQRHRQQISEQQPVMMDKVGSDLLLGCLLAVADDTPMVLGCLIAPPFHEQTAAMVQLSLGWLYYRWDVLRQANDGHSASLLELLGYVLSQSEPREAAQEWINRTAAWAKEVEGAADFLLMLFHMEENTPVFQVMSGGGWGVGRRQRRVRGGDGHVQGLFADQVALLDCRQALRCVPGGVDRLGGDARVHAGHQAHLLADDVAAALAAARALGVPLTGRGGGTPTPRPQNPLRPPAETLR